MQHLGTICIYFLQLLNDWLLRDVCEQRLSPRHLSSAISCHITVPHTEKYTQAQINNTFCSLASQTRSAFVHLSYLTFSCCDSNMELLACRENQCLCFGFVSVSVCVLGLCHSLMSDCVQVYMCTCSSTHPTVPEISSRHCLAVLLQTRSFVGLRHGSGGTTVVQSFSEYVLSEPKGKITN